MIIDRPLGLAATGGLFLTIALGAFGTHVLEPQLATRELEIYETAIQYLAWQSLAMGWLSMATIRVESWLKLLLIMGTIVFSGSLMTIALTSIKAFGMITPVGGLMMLFAWAKIFLEILYRKIPEA